MTMKTNDQKAITNRQPLFNFSNHVPKNIDRSVIYKNGLITSRLWSIITPFIVYYIYDLRTLLLFAELYFWYYSFKQKSHLKWLCFMKVYSPKKLKSEFVKVNENMKVIVLLLQF